jgi:hypothetical protein
MQTPKRSTTSLILLTLAGVALAAFGACAILAHALGDRPILLMQSSSHTYLRIVPTQSSYALPAGIVSTVVGIGLLIAARRWRRNR